MQFVACAQTPKQKLPAQLQSAERHNLAGIAAESRQKFIAAESEFMEAYRLFSAVENYRGMVTSLVNSSRLYRRQGDTSRAEKVIKPAVDILPHATELEAEVCFEMTKLALARGDDDGAVIWANRGVNSAADIDRGRMLNLHALTYMQKADLPKAKEIAGSALKASRAATDRREEANSFRILGDIAYAGKGYRESLEMYAAALPIDKDMALSIRISDDLRGMARSIAASGDLESAAVYYQRSASVNMAARDFKRGADDLEMLRKVFERTDNRERLSEAAGLLEKITPSGSNPEHR